MELSSEVRRNEPRARGKKPCRCGHAKTIHYAVHPKLKHYCRFPGCKCRDQDLDAETVR